MSSCSIPTKAPRSIRNRGTSSSTSAEIVGDLDDVLIKILSLLPVKALLRAKRVSKRWLSLITNPDFAHHYIKSKHPLPISGFFLKEPRNIEYRFVSLEDHDANNERLSLSLPLRIADHSSEMIIMQSTNGLLLCKCSCSPNQFSRNYYVYNPTTKQNTLLPRIVDSVALSLAFDPSKSPHYKVISLRRSRNTHVKSSTDHDDLYHIEVYSSTEGPWRRVLSVPSSAVPEHITELCNTVFWNGVVHWFGHESRVCLTFDINQERIKILQYPNPEDEEEEPYIQRTLRYLSESRGNLYFTEVNYMGSSNLRVYQMETDGTRWSLKHDIDLEPLAAAFPEMIRTDDYNDWQIYEFSVLSSVHKEKDAESYILLHIPNEVVKYNFSNKTFKKLCGFEALVNEAPDYTYNGFRKSFHFIESLANV